MQKSFPIDEEWFIAKPSTNHPVNEMFPFFVCFSFTEKLNLVKNISQFPN